jgi:MFS family permease
VSANAELLWLLAEHLLLTALPMALAAFLAMRAGLRSVPLLLCIALAASGVAAMLAFWAYYLDPTIGQAVAFLIVLGSIQGIVLARPDRLDREILRQLAVPGALWALGSAFVLFLGFLHGGTDQPLATATMRFSHPLPTDNEIPRFFADWYFAHGHHGPPPPFGDWLSSDRPPLQTGYVLAQRPFGWDDAGLHYQVLGVVVQQLWIVGMWALLCAARLQPRAKGLAIFALMASDIAIVHGFFVWPKLIAAAFLLAVLAMVLADEWEALRHDLRAAGLFAALCGLAMLAHGASAFGLIPLLIFAAVRGMPGWRWLGVAALAGVVLLAPWSAYQHFEDPPGNRLLKWQLGGSLAIDDRGTAETILDGYRDAGVGGTLANKWGNVTRMVGQGDLESAVPDGLGDLRDGYPGRAIEALRLPRFFDLLPLIGFLLLGPVAMLIARVRRKSEGREWSFALACFAFCGLACAIWALLMFGEPDSATLLHVGTLAVPLLGACACVVGAYAVQPRLAVALVALNSAFVLALYIPALTPTPGTSYSVLAAVLAAAALGGFGLVAYRQAVA